MRELSVRIKFTTHCLGKEKKHYRDPSSNKVRYKFVFNRSGSGRVIFLPTWWRAIVLKASELLSRHQDAVKNIRFGCEIDGQPDKKLYSRYYESNQFANHEVFLPGSVIGFTCAVPDGISDEDLERLLNLAGRYFGISPARPNEFGFFEVASVQRSGVGNNSPPCHKGKPTQDTLASSQNLTSQKRNRRSEVKN